MPELSTLKRNGIVYDLKDEISREGIEKMQKDIVELTVTLEDGIIETFKLYGEKVTE